MTGGTRLLCMCLPSIERKYGSILESYRFNIQMEENMTFAGWEGGLDNIRGVAGAMALRYMHTEWGAGEMGWVDPKHG